MKTGTNTNVHIHVHVNEGGRRMQGLTEEREYIQVLLHVARGMLHAANTSTVETNGESEVRWMCKRMGGPMRRVSSKTGRQNPQTS